MRIPLLLLVFLALTRLSFADALPGPGEAISLHKEAGIVDLGYLDLSFEEFLKAEDTLTFRALAKKAENIDFTDKHHWVRFSLHNPRSDTAYFFFRIARPITDAVDLYQRAEDGQLVVKHSGDMLPFTARDFQHRENIFHLSLAPQTHYTFYVHLKSDGEMIVLPLQLYEPGAFIKETSQTELLYGIYYGLLLIAAIVYLFFYKSLRQATFLYYGLYIISFGALQFSLDGYMHQYVFPHAGWFYSKIVLVTASSTTILLGLYAERFLDINAHFKRFPVVFKAIYFLTGLLFVGLMISNAFLAFTYPLINALALFLIFLIIAVIINLRVIGKPVDPFFSLGIFFLTAGLIVFILNNFSLVPSNFLTQNSSKIGSGLEVIFLSLSMSNLIKKLREEKENSQRLALQNAQEANDLKLHLMSNVSHELRTPLNVIMGNSSKILKEGELQPDQEREINIIKHSAEVLLGSINNLLDFYKIEKNELRIAREPFLLRETLVEIDKKWRRSVETKALGFTFSIDQEIPEYAWGDAERLKQTVENLLENAIKFTQQGNIGIQVSQNPLNKKRTELYIKIKDTGMGIPEEKLTSMLKGFRQERVDDKRAFGGLGLGLSIAKRIVDLHGGTLRIESKLNLGTTCHLRIPYTLVPASEHPHRTVEVNEPELDPLHILVVEDNKLNQMVLQQMLSKWKNASYSIADNGREALEKLREEHMDLILMDLQMPVMDGYEATQLIRSGEAGEQYRSIPIIAVTADITETTKEKVRVLGMNDYQSKPFTAKDLYNKVYKQSKRVQ